MTAAPRARCLAMILVFAASPVFAQTEADDIGARVKDGQKVTITDERGQQFHGRVTGRTASGLSMVVNGKAVDIPYAQIARVDRPHDGLANGALIGFATGAVLGLAAVAGADDNGNCNGEFFCGDATASNYAAGALIFGGIGAAVGVGIDALIHKKGEIYRRAGPHITVAPTVARGVRGIVVMRTW